MGGYFLTNNCSKDIEMQILDFFAKKGMNEFTIFPSTDFKLIYFKKIKPSITSQIFIDGEDFLFGVGTFFYENQFGKKALETIYYHFKEKFDYELFNKVRGHFNFIFYINNILYIITDKTGTYHSYLAEESSYFYISTSFYSLVNCVNQITIRKQELLEFIMVEAFFNGFTPVNEINLLNFGYIYILNKSKILRKNKYFHESEIEHENNISNQYSAISMYFDVLNGLRLKISADLSAGYDSRLVCSIMKKMGINFTYNTNTNVDDSSDVKIARKIADKEKKIIQIYKKETQKYNISEILANSFLKNELIRDNFRGIYTPIYFHEKSQDFDMVLGGYGGELYRDVKYKGIGNINELITKYYIDYKLVNLISSDDIEIYKKNLGEKMNFILKTYKSGSNKVQLEKIYYFLKMAYWGGSRITYFNQYLYRFHPLLDYELIYPLFHIDDHEKRDALFQMKLIEKFDHQLASYSSNYGYNFLLESNYFKKFKRRKKIISSYIKHKYDQIYRKIKPLNQQIITSPRDFIKGKLLLNCYLNLNNTKLEKNADLGKLYTLEHFLRINREKIKKLEDT